MKGIPAFNHFERTLRDEHRQQALDERAKLEGEVPAMPPPKHYGAGHGAPVKPPVGAFKSVTASIPSADFLVIHQRATAKGWALSTYLKQLIHADVQKEQAAA